MKRFLGSLLILLAMSMFSSCELVETTGSVKVQNLTGRTIIVDVNDGAGNWRGEKTLYSGSSRTYTSCAIGEIDGAARFSGESNWYYSSTRTLTAGGTVTISWSPTKKSGSLDNMGEVVDGVTVNTLDSGRHSK